MQKIIFLILTSLYLGQSQSLSELTQVALEQNLDLKILEKEYRAALERAPQVSQLPDPEIGIGGFPLPVQTRLGPQVMRWSATQKFPWFGVLESKENLELAKARAIQQRIAARALNLKYEVEQAYFRLYELQESQVIIQRNLKLLESLEQVALAKVESGKATMVDVLRVQLQLEEWKQELKILAQLETKPESVINQLLNRELTTEIVILDSLEFVEIGIDRIAIARNISNQHPMIKMYQLQQEIAQNQLKVNELVNKPAFGIGVDYIFVNERTDATFLDNGRDIVQFRATVSLPIYRKAYEAKAKEEQFKIEALDQQQTNTLSQFLTSIEQAFADYESAKLRLELYQKQKEITQVAINILESNYSTANSDFEELLRSEKELIEYDLKVLKAIVQNHLAKSAIERFVVWDENTD
ncbi:MAG: TolC family protein [Bacteroidota bacterium]